MQWSEERIEAHKRYVGYDTAKIAYWKRQLAKDEEAVERSKLSIAHFEERRLKSIAELAEQGVVIETEVSE